MKLLMVTPFYSQVIGGTENFIKNAVFKLNEIGVATDVLTYRFGPSGQMEWKTTSATIGNSKIIEIPGHEGTRALKLFQMSMVPGPFQSFMKQYDIIHYHNETDLSLPLFSFFVKKPKIMHCHCLDVSYAYFKRNPVSRHILKSISDIYMTVSSSMKHLLVDLGVKENDIRLVPNGVDSETFRPNYKNKADDVLLFTGRIVPTKGLHILLKSLKYIKTPIKLVIIGPQSNLFPMYYNEILEMIKENNKKSIHSINFLGVQTKEKLVEWYQRATIFVCPSLSEPFGIVNLEALSCETPVIASNVGGIPEVVKNKENGILVPSGNPEELAKSVQFLLDNERLRRIYGKRGRQMAVKDFSYETIALHLRALYKSMLY